jgi:dipeptidyl aminopeptidase/acylaminoacyl peptidase
MSNLKKILLILGLIIVTTLLAYGIYYFFKKTGPISSLPTNQGDNQQNEANQFNQTGNSTASTSIVTSNEMVILPSAGMINIQEATYYQPEYSQPLVTENTINASVSNAGGIRYYNESDGKFYKTDTDGNKQALSEREFYNVQNITWANKDDKAVLEYPDGSKIIYNFANDKQVSLPKHWEEFNFSPDDTKIAAKSLGLSPENRWLVTMNDDGSGTRLISPLGENADKVTISWSPNNKSIAFTETGEALGAYRKEILFVGLNGENFKSFVAEGMDFRAKWADAGDKILYSVYSSRTDYRPEIWVVNADGSTIGSGRKNIELNTWAEKCTFGDSNTLYCAVPRSLPTGAGITPAIANNTYDDIYKIDLATGFKNAVTTGGDYTVNTIEFDKNSGKLIFTDKNKSGIYEIGL